MANRARYSKSREELHALNARYLKFLIQVLINASIENGFYFSGSFGQKLRFYETIFIL